MNSPAIHPLRILVVDDEALICDTVKLILKSDGHFVETAGNGPEALAKFQRGSFDLVVTDYSMPEMTGDELAAAIKAGAATCPVVMITAYAGMLPSPLPGVDCIISKPFQRHELRAAIARLT